MSTTRLVLLEQLARAAIERQKALDASPSRSALRIAANDRLAAAVAALVAFDAREAA
jgi:hypothetical protein